MNFKVPQALGAVPSLLPCFACFLSYNEQVYC